MEASGFKFEAEARVYVDVTASGRNRAMAWCKVGARLKSHALTLNPVSHPYLTVEGAIIKKVRVGGGYAAHSTRLVSRRVLLHDPDTLQQHLGGLDLCWSLRPALLGFRLARKRGDRERMLKSTRTRQAEM